MHHLNLQRTTGEALVVDKETVEVPPINFEVIESEYRLENLLHIADTRTRRPDDAEHLPRLEFEGHAAEHLGHVGTIAKAHLVEGHVAANGRKAGAVGVIFGLGRRVQDVAQTVDRDTDLLEILPELREAKDRCRHAARQHVDQRWSGTLFFHDLSS